MGKYKAALCTSEIFEEADYSVKEYFNRFKNIYGKLHAMNHLKKYGDINEMDVYHGTARYNVLRFTKGIQKWPQVHTPRHKAALCTSKSFKEAAFFAMRKTPANDLDKTGVVLQFELDPTSVEGKDYVQVRDSVALRNENEIAVFNVDKLRLVSVWNIEDDEWKEYTPEAFLSKYGEEQLK